VQDDGACMEWIEDHVVDGLEEAPVPNDGKLGRGDVDFGGPA